jgi:hypothetical protein
MKEASSRSARHIELEEVVVHTTGPAATERIQPRNTSDCVVAPPAVESQAVVSPRSDFAVATLANSKASKDSEKKQLQPLSENVDADFIRKVDAHSGRPYWVNLSSKVTSWTPPAGWNKSTAVILPSAASHRTAAANSTGEKAVVTAPKTVVGPLATGVAGSRKSNGHSIVALDDVVRKGRDSPPPPPPPDGWA